MDGRNERKGLRISFFSRITPAPVDGARSDSQAELPYLFGNLQFAARQGDLRTLELADRRLSQTMMRYWAQFAASGDPNGDGLPLWPVYGSREVLLRLDDEVVPGPWPRAEALDLLDRLFNDQTPDSDLN